MLKLTQQILAGLGLKNRNRNGNSEVQISNSLTFLPCYYSFELCDDINSALEPSMMQLYFLVPVSREAITRN